MLADCTAHSAALPRLVLLYDLTLSYYPLPLCLRFGSLTQFPSTLDLYDLAAACQGSIAALAAIFALSLVCDYTALKEDEQSGSG